MNTDLELQRADNTLAKVTLLLWHVWDALVRPVSSTTNQEERRRVRLLAAVLVAVFVTGTLILVSRAIQMPGSMDDADFLGSVFSLFAILGLYVLNRHGHTDLAALTLIGLMLVLFVGIAFAPNSLRTLLYFSVIPILLAALFFSARVVTWVTSITIIASVLLSQVSSRMTLMDVFDASQLILLSAMVIIVYINHTRAVEQIRRAQLQSAYDQVRASEAALEQRVEARTRDLQVAAEVSRQVTTVLDRASLLAQLVELTRAGFEMDHVAVYIHDPARHVLELAATTGSQEKRATMLGATFSLADSKQGLVLEAARQHRAVIVNDVHHDARYFANPLLSNTNSEAVFPMRVGNLLIGVLDLQSNRQARFTEDDTRVLTSLAEQIGIAVRNAQLYTESQSAQQEAEKANRVKSQFLAAMSHELRTPLNAILNFSQFVSSGMLGTVNDEQVDVLNKITSSGKHLLSLINDVLDISKIESGALTLFVEAEVDLTEELKAVEAAGRSLLNGKPVEFIVDVQKDLPRVVGDRRRIRQIILNLVSNACKFTEEGQVTIQLCQKGDSEVLLTVRDTGPGIAPEDHPAIFETFRQTEAGLRHSEGTGLGLPISLRLAEAHGGRLWLESTLGQGSTFYVALPIRSLHLLQMIRSAEKKEATT